MRFPSSGCDVCLPVVECAGRGGLTSAEGAGVDQERGVEGVGKGTINSFSIPT